MDDQQTAKMGEVIDSRYRIIGVLGRGGMGSVYRGEHIAIRQPVAIKLLHPEIASRDDFSRRFEREAFAAAHVANPNCVRVTDFGTLPDGRLYLVMEYLDGILLSRLLDQETRLPVRRSLHILRHVLRGLHFAHKAGVIHRDLKPDNVVLVEERGDPDFAKILDFGLAKLEGEAASGQQVLTQAGIALGTPIYMAPDTLSQPEVDHRVDLYAAAVMLFEMIAGVPPFQADDAQSVLTMHIRDIPPTLAQVAPEAEAPPEVESLIRHGLEKNRDQRIPSAQQFIAEIDRILGDRAVSFVPTITAPVAPPPARTPPVAPATPAAVAPAGAPVPQLRAAWRDATARRLPGNGAYLAPGSRSRRIAITAGTVLGLGLLTFAVSRIEDSQHQMTATAGLAPTEMAAAAADEVRTITVEDVDGLDRVRELAAARRHKEALDELKTLQQEHPDNGYIHYLKGNIYFDLRWWSDGFAAYRAAIARDDSYRADPLVIRNAIRSLQSSNSYRKGEEFLSEEIGSAAIPHLEQASASESASIRRRSSALLARMRTR
jgi:tRNA A-37 threonylcarbamoyl transferase component Bud32